MNTFDSVSFDNLQLKNRLLMAPIKTAFSNLEGKVTPRLIEYYKRRAQGGVGAIIIESSFVDPRGKEHPKQLGISSDDHIEGLKTLTAALQAEGTKVIAHLNHAGRAANPKAMGSAPEAPSELTCPTTGVTPEIMSISRIQEVVDEYAEAAKRAVEAGFDAVELQCGLGYLIHQFYSEKMNTRDDEYGGSIENRLRFADEVIYAIKEKVGNNYPIIARISAAVDGTTKDISESLYLAKWLEEKGIHALHVASGSACDSPPWYYQHMRLPSMKNLEWSKKIKEEVNIPVIGAGRLGNPELLRKAFAENSLDAAALGRALVVDPDFPNKMESQVDAEITRCGACMQGCLVGVKSGKGIGCIANPEVGFEAEITKAPETTGKIVIIGGGPAGIQAALTAARQGYGVVLFEKKELGGQFNLAVIPPGKEEMKKPLESMILHLEHENITLHDGVQANIDLILAENPDKVFIATGSKTMIPPIPGLDKYLVCDDVFEDVQSIGKSVLIIGGGMIGMETAEFLVSQDHDVTVVEILDEFAQDMEPITRKLMLKYFASTSARLLKSTAISRINGKTVFISKDGKEEELGQFDSIVVATGVVPDNSLAADLEKHGISYSLIGDAKEPGNIVSAVSGAYKAVLDI